MFNGFPSFTGIPYLLLTNSTIRCRTMAAQSALHSVDEPWRLLSEAHARLSEQLERRILRECGLTMQQFRALTTLSRTPAGLRMNGLAQAMNMSKSGLTRLVDRLEAQGWVTRIPADDDRRAVRTAITADGERVLATAMPMYLQALRETLYSALSPTEAEELSALLRRLLAGLESTPPDV